MAPRRRDAAAAARTVRTTRSTSSALSGDAVIAANGLPSRTRGFASITAATCEELTVACACVSPSGSRSTLGPFQTTSGASMPAIARAA